MAHHSSEMDAEMRQRYDEMFSQIPKLGPTGQFPQGKLTARDEGEIRLAVGSKDGKVVIDFGSQVTWIGFDPAQARDIAALLIKHADAIDPR